MSSTTSAARAALAASSRRTISTPTAGCTRSLRRFLALGSLKTRRPSPSRSREPSGRRISRPKASTSLARSGVPGAWSSWTIASASITTAPSAASRRATLVLPLPIPPVSPTTRVTRRGSHTRTARDGAGRESAGGAGGWTPEPRARVTPRNGERIGGGWFDRPHTVRYAAPCFYRALTRSCALPSHRSRRPPRGPMNDPGASKPAWQGDTSSEADAAELARLRGLIDRVDRELLDALNRRAALVQQVGALKGAAGRSAVYRAARERDLVEALVRENRGPFPSAALPAVYREIISASRALEAQLRVAYLGPPGTSSHVAAREALGAQTEIVPVAAP